jgi:hypothetical protein
MSFPYVDHAYRHIPGGTDPIPGLSSGSAVAVAVARYSASTSLTGGNDDLTLFSFKTTDATVFDTAAGTGGHTGATGVRFLADGAYTVQAGAVVQGATAADVLELYYAQGGGSPRGYFGDGKDREVYPSTGYSNILYFGWMESHDVNVASIPSPTAAMIFYVKNRTGAGGTAGGQVFFTYYGPGDIDV